MESDTTTELPGFYARLTAPPLATDPPNVFYDFAEVEDDGTGSGWQTVDGCIRGIYYSDAGTFNAYPISGNAKIPVPGPPINVQANSLGLSYFYTITSAWKRDSDGALLQSGESLEVSTLPGAPILDWDAPAPVEGFTLLGFSVWKGFRTGGEDIWLVDIDVISGQTHYFYQDPGGGFGTLERPIPGGNAGPIVWMIPKAAADYCKFIDITQARPGGDISQWIQVYSSATNHVLLGTGTSTASTACFQAQIMDWSNIKGKWFGTGSGTVWANEANQGVLMAGVRYRAWPEGGDRKGRSIYMTFIPNTWLESSAGPTALGTGWKDTGLKIRIPANTVWKLAAQLTADITGGTGSPFFGIGDYLQFRYFGSAVGTAAGINKQYGVPVKCCYIICEAEYLIDAAPLNAVVQAPGKDIVVKVQGMVIAASGSTGNMERSILDANQES
jgi:hypothetical protein